ncbi:MAG: chorismate synthase [Phycisphaerae bacterium]|nr:chorismate synthase [Phycisphaerae bacterium]
MATLDYRTAGESHGPCVLVLIEGLPAGLRVDLQRINAELRRRQGGYGRGARQRIERDEAQVLSGVRRGMTIGSPVVLQIVNRDSRLDQAPALHRPRPGHADYAGAMKWLTTDCRETLERASARETAARVAAGALASCLLAEFDIDVVGFSRQIGAIAARVPDGATAAMLRRARDANDVYCPDRACVATMRAAIRHAKIDRDTVGGVVEARVFGVPVGLGSCARWQDKLDGRLMGAVGSVQAIKGVEIGLGFGSAARAGSAVHDEIDFVASQRGRANLGFVRRTNNAGGLEGGMTNGMPIVVRAAMKPISTLLRGLDSVNLRTLQPERSDYERSDVCAVPAASVVVQNVVAFEIARVLVDKYGGDTLREVRAAHEFHLRAARALPMASAIRRRGTLRRARR